MKLVKIIIIVSISAIFLSSCQDVKDGLTGKKISQGEEFLIKKKNPLVVPPDFDLLPEPKLEKEIEGVDNLENEDQDIKKLLMGNSKKNTSSESNNSNDNIEKSILKKINKN
tara:strand:+ start:525 stop:860 length:336 start_codon:yes stop_codon:yes gene_type:complete